MQATIYVLIPEDEQYKPVQAEELLEQLERYLTLSWIYDADSPTSVAVTADVGSSQAASWIVPQPQELETLYASARIGDIWAVEAEAKRLQASNPEYQLFISKVLQLAQDMNEQAILKLVKPYAEVSP